MPRAGGELPCGLVEPGAEEGLRGAVAERECKEGAQAHTLGQGLPAQRHRPHRRDRKTTVL